MKLKLSNAQISVLFGAKEDGSVFVPTYKTAEILKNLNCIEQRYAADREEQLAAVADFVKRAELHMHNDWHAAHSLLNQAQACESRANHKRWHITETGKQVVMEAKS